MVHSAITGTFARFLASLKEQGIETNMVRNGAEVVGMIERLCFSSRPELQMSCGIHPLSISI